MTKGTDVITLTYTADGEKLTKTSPAGTRNYIAGIEYLGANLEAIYHAEGRCTPNTGSTFYYEYTIKDHLGNARVNFRANGTAVTFLEEMHYYPFGMLMEGIGATAVTVNKYKYNGKELNDDLGLNLSDYGARWYDAALGRWWAIEPLASKFISVSPYNYVFNNPLLVVDIDGRDTIVINRFGLNSEMSDGSTHVYNISFSIIQNGVETEITNSDVPIYMFASGYYDTPGNQGADPLTQSTYTLEFAQMSRHQGQWGWENTIRVYKGIFIHPAEDAEGWLSGCVSVCTKFNLKSNKKFESTTKEESRRALQAIRDLFDAYASSLSGDKFLLRTNYTPKMKKREVPIRAEPATIDRSDDLVPKHIQDLKSQYIQTPINNSSGPRRSSSKTENKEGKKGKPSQASQA